jgi:hypothetical protein
MRPLNATALLAVTLATIIPAAAHAATAPANDDRADATALSQLPASVTGTTVGATFEHAEPGSRCTGFENSVWYEVRPHTSGRIVISAAADGKLDLVVDVFKQVRSQTEPVTCDVSDENGNAATDFNATAGANAHWSDSGFPISGNDYITTSYVIRTLNLNTNYTFAGDTLSLIDGGRFFLRNLNAGNIDQVNFNATKKLGLLIDGGEIRNCSANGVELVVAGAIEVGPNGALFMGNGGNFFQNNATQNNNNNFIKITANITNPDPTNTVFSGIGSGGAVALGGNDLLTAGATNKRILLLLIRRFDRRRIDFRAKTLTQTFHSGIFLERGGRWFAVHASNSVRDNPHLPGILEIDRLCLLAGAAGVGDRGSG